jgi:polygalacturonase
MPRHFRIVPLILTLAATAVAQQYSPPPLPPEVKYPSDKVVKISDLGAVADGKTLASDAIAKAIDQVSAAGGGIVQFARTDGGAEYLSGAIHFKSNVTLQIDEGVTLKFTTDRTKYPLVKSRWECTDVMNYSPLIYAYQCENIRITGKGTIDGQGQTWWDWRNGKPAMGVLRQYTNDREGKFPLEQRVFGEQVQGLRPCLIEPYESKNILIEGVTIRNSPFWTIHPVYCENIILRNANVFGTGPNTDGIDPDSCKNVLIEGTTFTTGDDCVVIKSGRDGDGIRKNRTCENITIRNCIMKGGHGAITMGSETSAGIKHVFAENCQVDGPDSAIRLKSTRGRGGGIEDVYVRNITVNRTLKYAITIDMRYTQTAEAPKSETTPVFKNIRIEDFKCEASPQAIYIMGLVESNVENVILKNISIKADRGGHLEYVNGVTRENVVITPRTGEVWVQREAKDVKDVK